MNKLLSLFIFVAAIIIILRACAALAQTPQPPLGIVQPGPTATTDYYNATGDYRGQSQTTIQQPYPYQPTITVQPDYRRHMLPNGYRSQR